MNYASLASKLKVQIFFIVILSLFAIYKLINGDVIPLLKVLTIAAIFAVSLSLIKKTYMWYLIKNDPLSITFLYLLIISSFIGAGFFTLDLGPLSLFPYRILLLVMCVLFFSVFVKEKEYMRMWSKVKVKKPIFFLIFWLLYALLSLLWVRSLTGGLQDFIFLSFGIVIVFLVTFYFHNQNNYYNFFYIWIVMTAVLVGIGLWNHFTHQHLPVSRINHVSSYQQGIPTAVFVNENDYASFLAISFFFVLAFVNHAKTMIKRGAGFVLLALIMYVIMLTDSRANYISVMLGLAFWFLFLIKRRAKIKVTFLAVIGFGLGMLSGRFRAIVGKFDDQLGTLLASSDIGSDSVNIRINLIRNAFDFLRDTFGLGIGSGNVEFYMKNLSAYDTFGEYNMHNWWMEILVHHGILIFSGYVLLYIFLIWNLYKANRTSSGTDRMISEALVSSLIAFLLASISPNSFLALNYNWLLIAFALGFINYKRLTDKKKNFLVEEAPYNGQEVNYGNAK
ncbi:O-antigen ligase family protein [Pseudalkalibacillus caeni]|uniref:O-antigen ligase family protein n=1 Tax=Exobacillus caeni TaxID=2574798 RepID=A0A5R9F8C5_9BACL|nr:O-antigen ligase family protein [Pseudalkalibacillus caeni]TLS38500.1 O-antigen ligase family protein [Pseudalkalibacillus caeni]